MMIEEIMKLKKTSKLKLIFTSIGLAIPLIFLIVLEISGQVFDAFEVLTDLLIIRYVIFIIVEVFLVYKIYTYSSIVNSDEYANKFYINKEDERNKYIKMKTNSKTIEIVLYLLGLALICTAFTTRQIFYTLLVVFVCLILTYLIIRLWYTKKY